MNTIGFFFWGGGADFTKGSKPGYPKTENFTELNHYFFLGGGREELNFTFETKHTQMSDFPPTGRSHQINENMAEDDIFM